jgi:NADPH:quinone reductase-like Zn-dependent oxidoreductase
MRAAAFSSFGGPDVLRLSTVDIPRPGPGQVRVRVRAAGVQPYDCSVRSGWVPPGATLTWPVIPGNEFAGVVDEPGDSGFSAGDEVLGFGRLGAYAEFIVVPAKQVTLKPAGMPWEVAGGFSAGAQTAHIALELLGVGRGDTLLVHAAAGAVGGAAVQLAREMGATVIGTASPANHEYLRALGAVPVAYGEGLSGRVSALAPGGVDAALDGAGGPALDASVELVKDRDRILTLVDHGRAGELGVRLVPGDLRSAARLAELADRYAQGQLSWHVRAAYPLARAADAHRDVETGHGRGKVVITLD